MESLIEEYFRRGHRYKVIQDYLNRHHGFKISLRTVKRVLRKKGLRRNGVLFHAPEALVTRAVQQVQDSSSKIFWYLTIWYLVPDSPSIIIKMYSGARFF